MFEQITDQEKQAWYYNHQQEQLNKGNYYDPCLECEGLDCICCSYGNGY